MRHLLKQNLIGQFLAKTAAALLASLLGTCAYAAAPGITGPTFNLDAAPAYITQPDGAAIYSWGYGCSVAPAGFAPATMGGANGTAPSCPTMQIPGPTLIVREGDTVKVNLTNNLPAPAGNTSILFPGFSVTTSGGVAGLLTQEAAPGTTVTYTFTATSPGTHAYYSGTKGDVQIEMGLYGAIIVLPTSGLSGNTPTETLPSGVPPDCHALASGTLPDGQPDFRLAASAYDISQSCYDREYLFQFAEIDPRIHSAAEAQSTLSCTDCMIIDTEPYHPAYYVINGRSMPDSMDPNYAPQFPHQPYNGNPHVHPGERALIRITGTGRMQHPFHEHANHLHILARDGNLLLSATDPTKLAGPLLFTTTTTPGLAMDGIFYWTGRGLNWDVFGHTASGAGAVYNIDTSADPAHASYNGQPVVCNPDANGYYTTASGAPPNAPNYYEWCQDHKKPLENHPFGDVAGGGPVTLPDPNILTNGLWYGGSPYLGPDATGRAIGPSSTTPPSGTIGNPSNEAGFAFMWHSHNEREITTNNVFPGGMMLMLLVDPQAFVIDEEN